jgi:hypothetical protein
MALVAAVAVGCAVAVALVGKRAPDRAPAPAVEPVPPPAPQLDYQRRSNIDTSGYFAIYHPAQPPWPQTADLKAVADAHTRHLAVALSTAEELLATQARRVDKVLLVKAALLHSQGKATEAYAVLEQLEAAIRGGPLEAEVLYTVIFYKGVTGLRIGETENCVLCRGESSCLYPLAPAAVHTNPAGSRLAIKHFTEYLNRFPDDREVKWLLNLAHMTLGEHPHKVDPRYLLTPTHFTKSEFDLGAFREVSHRAGITRLNQSGGAIMEDFDGDGLLDLVVTDWSPSGPMALYRNKGDGTFEDRSAAAGLTGQWGGLYCVQTDYNNDGHLDIFVPRGAWMPAHMPIRPSLLRNNGNGTFSDVTLEAGLGTPLNANSASWGDYDNDGHLDLYVSGNHRPALLYRNKGDGTFEDVGARAGLPTDKINVQGAAWIDYDSDGYPDLFLNVGKTFNEVFADPAKGVEPGRVNGAVLLYRNNRNGTFTDVTKDAGIDGPISGFSCWAWDYDNDGHPDLFASSSIHSLDDVIKGMLGQPHDLPTARLYRNTGGKGFRDVTKEAGLDGIYAPMGSNFADLDNDGFLDFYLATGNPELVTLIPNRLFKNVGGKRFADVTASSRTGHLQKGHGVAFGDWRRVGTPDLFVQVGGAVEGDRYHNLLFQNPGHGNNWLSVKLVGAKTEKPSERAATNRAAIGARIKVVTVGTAPQTVYRHVSSGSSFGANTLEQHIGLGKAGRVATLEIYWPTSGTTQVFRDVAINQYIEITEFAKEYKTRAFKTLNVPE